MSKSDFLREYLETMNGALHKRLDTLEGMMSDKLSHHDSRLNEIDRKATAALDEQKAFKNRAIGAAAIGTVAGIGAGSGASGIWKTIIAWLAY